MDYSGLAYSFGFAKKRTVLDSVKDENDNLLESINEFQVYQWLQTSDFSNS